MLPKIALSSQDSTLPINIARCQFPVRLACCLTINKAQEQSLRYVGIYLPKPVFSHGQLYVAISRTKSFSGLKVFTSHGENQGLAKFERSKDFNCMVLLSFTIVSLVPNQIITVVFYDF